MADDRALSPVPLGSVGDHREDDADDDFSRQLELLGKIGTTQLRDNWRVFTKVKDAVDQGRRLENASWRLWHKGLVQAKEEGAGAVAAARAAPLPDVDDTLLRRLDASLAEAGRLAQQSSSLIFGVSETTSDDEEKKDASAASTRAAPSAPRAGAAGGAGGSERTRAVTASLASAVSQEEEEAYDALCLDLWRAREKHGAALSSSALQDVLDALHGHGDRIFSGSKPLPRTVAALRKAAMSAKSRVRPRAAAFSHSLERNGANNFLLYAVRRLAGPGQSFELFSPSEGPMRGDFEALGIPVTILNPMESNYMDVTREKLQNVGAVLANTIMRAEVVSLCQEAGLPYVWVIHEAWPREQFDHYAAKVFQMEHISPTVIRDAFRNATPDTGAVVFPAAVQRDLYKGLVPDETCRVVYNGIPLESINVFRASTSRRRVRAEMGYSDDDFVVLHLGTICSRKAQQTTATAFTRLVKDDGCTNAKLLMVGARYIRDHEIEYLKGVKKILSDGGMTDRSTILDIQSDVLKFYMAADVVLVPSLNEVLPLVISEAMAFERPIVASRIDGIPEAIDDGVEGLLVPPGDADALANAVLRLYGSAEERQKMGHAGRKRVIKQFSYETMSRAYRELMDTVTSSAAAAREAAVVKPPAVPRMSGSAMDSDAVLVDMDSVIVDWDRAFLERWCALHPEREEADRKMMAGRTHYEVEENFPPEFREHVVATLTEPGMYLAMEPIPGAVEALRAMVAAGLDVRIVTAPHPACAASCASEKFQWVERFLGSEWISRLILARDKTHVHGAVLIDDKPAITGSTAPSWEHIVFAQPWNLHVTDKRRMDAWKDWRALILGDDAE